MTIGTVAEVVKAVGAIDYQSDARFEPISMVTFDARNIKPGGLFVPLKGTTDGHEYVHQAIENGALAVLWGRNDAAPDGICTIWVDDPLEAFQKLANWYLEKVSPTVIAITGSSGKTTTKDMTAAVLASTYRVHKTDGNFNNEIGLPQTILNMPQDTEYLVLEMGMSGFGEIAFLSQLAKPTIAVITMIGESHLEHLGSREGIARAKVEIIQGLREEGALITPAHEPLISQTLNELDELPAFHHYTFGEDESAQLRGRIVSSSAKETTFILEHYPDIVFSIPLIGAYNMFNALSAIQVGLLCHVPVETIREALSTFELTKNRIQWVGGLRGCQLLNDTYNASPVAMKAVLKAFSEISLPAEFRKIAVLGDMLELGPDSKELHASVATAILNTDIKEVYLYGEQMKALQNALLPSMGVQSIHHYMDKEKLIVDLKEVITDKDYLVLKSSNGTGLMQVVKALEA